MAVMFHGGAEAASAEPVWFEMGDVTISLRSDLSSLRKKKNKKLLHYQVNALSMEFPWNAGDILWSVWLKAAVLSKALGE